jgi:hypothetical protein
MNFRLVPALCFIGLVVTIAIILLAVNALGPSPDNVLELPTQSNPGVTITFQDKGCTTGFRATTWYTSTEIPGENMVTANCLAEFSIQAPTNTNQSLMIVAITPGIKPIDVVRTGKQTVRVDPMDGLSTEFTLPPGDTLTATISR